MDTQEAALLELERVFGLIVEEHQERGQALPKDTTSIVHALVRRPTNFSGSLSPWVSRDVGRREATNGGYIPPAEPSRFHSMVAVRSVLLFL